MLIRSTDEGKTWSKPETIIDSPHDDRHPSLIELPDGTLICSFFTLEGMADPKYGPPHTSRVYTVRSWDGGRTWEQKLRPLPSPFIAEETDGPMILLKDGSVLLTVDGVREPEGIFESGFFVSKNRGTSWELLSTVATEHELTETNTAQLPDGRLVMIARPEGDICWSSDGGRTWTKPVGFGFPMYAPSLYVLRDGTLLCLYGSSAPAAGWLRVIFSRDGGRTWVAPAPDHGFLVDVSYGYGKAIELPDGSLFAVYLSNAGHLPEDAFNNSIWSIRFRIRPDYSGIELLPAPGKETRKAVCQK